MLTWKAHHMIANNANCEISTCFLSSWGSIEILNHFDCGLFPYSDDPNWKVSQREVSR